MWVVGGCLISLAGHYGNKEQAAADNRACEARREEKEEMWDAINMQV